MQLLCTNCQKEFRRTRSQFLKSENHFCSKSCAAQYNNRIFPKRTAQVSSLCSCGRSKDRLAVRCHVCKIKHTLDIQNQRTLDDIASRGNARVKWSHLRQLARKVLILENRPRRCVVCGFDAVVHICHLRAISCFAGDTLVGVVNHPSNLVYLCPNHHVLLDRNLLTL